MYKSLTPNLMVSDVNETVKWYEEKLGFKFANEQGSLDDPQEWAIIKAGDVQIFFQDTNSLVKEMPALKDMKIGGSLTLYIKVEDIHGLYNLVKDKINILIDMKETFYGAKEFAIKDLNGYILVFSEMKE
jgi:uncharacterized glyoxalase superfamily protein PhnB